MKKKNQMLMKGISVALAVVVAATTVLHVDERLLARETFSGLKSILANNQQLTIVEVVDDFSESSMGYLFGGLEPYDVERAKREGTMDDLLDDLLGRGLLTMGDTDDWSSYPLRYEILETRYSELDGDEEILSMNGFRQQENEAAELSGYYVPITEWEPGDKAFYRCEINRYAQMRTMTPAQLKKEAEAIRDSYAPKQEDANGNKTFPDGYTIDASFQYFRFVVGDPKDAIEAQSVSNMSVYTGDSSVGAMYGIRVTEEASMEDAAPTPTDVEDENGDEMQPDGDNDPTIVPTPPELLDNDMTPTDTEEPDDTATPDSDANDNSATQEEGQSDNAVQSNDAEVPEDVTSQPDNAASTEQATTLSDENENENAGTDSASAVIYVEFDENNSVLVASLGNAGVGDVLDGTFDFDGGQSGAPKTTPSGSDAGIVSGAIPTVTPSVAPVPTPAQENGGDTSDSDKDGDSASNTGNTSATTPDKEENTDDESGSDNENTGDDGSDQGNTDGSENTDGDDKNAEDSDADGEDADNEDGEDVDSEDSEDGEDVDNEDDEDGDEDENSEDEAAYTVTYQWEGLDSEKGTFTEPALPTVGEDVEKVAEITIPEDPEEIEVTDSEGVKIGTYKFAGWKAGAADSDTDTYASVSAGDTITVSEDMTVIGTWSYCESGCYLVTYQWRLTGEEGSLPDGVTAGNIVLKSPFRTFDMSEQQEIGLPEEETVPEGSSYTLNDDYEGAVFEVYSADGKYIGIGTFEGWENSDGEALEGDIVPDGDMTVYGVLSVAVDTGYAITHQWRVRIDDSTSMNDLSFLEFPEDGIFSKGTTLPNGVNLQQGGFLSAVPEKLNEDTWNEGKPPYLPAEPNVKEISVYDENGDPVGKYIFVGWGSDVDGEWTILPSDGLTIESDITLYGVWSYEPEATAKLVPGEGYSYVYVNDTIHNNNWFRYYVMGLEEKDFGTVNIKLVTYLADGSDKREYGYGPDCPTLTEAIKKADLVYLNTDGQWLDDYGEPVSSDRRFPAETAKALLERACNADRSARLAVILDNGVRNNQVDENIQKVTAILCQEDVAEAYASLSENGMSYEKAFRSTEWQRLNALAISRNGGNFVHDNIYCVSHSRGEFNNSTYPANDSDVILGSMSALTNADFENRFTDRVTDAGFAEVYQAIQKENYERARNGGQASLDEYVMPATAVAYILNYRDYDPIIYKDKIRVLELEPCRDYTYYYDELDNPTSEGEMTKKRQFAEDWAPDFLDKLEADPDAITIDGMTTSEFCGKILDIYEEYDVIYIGSNNGILHTDDVVSGFKWVPMDAYDGTISADSPFRPYSWDSSQLFTYHDGKWYQLKWDGVKTKRIRVGSPVKDVEVWDGSATWKWSVAENIWYRNETPSNEPYSNWIGNFSQRDDQWVEHTYCYDQRIPSWCEFVKVYDEVEDSDGPGAPWYDNGSAETSGWLWNPYEWGMDCKVSENETQRVEARGWYKKEYVAAATYTTYYDTNMNGMLYTHVGDKMKYASSNYYGHLVNEAAYGYRSSGNDILATQVEELIDYLNGGSLVILSPDFMTTDENGRQIINSSDVKYKAGAQQSYCGILDTSSYVYQFVRSCFERKSDGSDVPKYSNLIVEDYGNGDLRDTEAFVEALNQQKVTLNLYAMPTQYGYEECAVSGTTGTVTNKWNGQKETYTRNYSHDITRIDEDTRFMLQKEADGRYYLNYEFIIGNLSAIAPLTTRYHVQLFLDSNSDGIYNTASEELDDITVINAQTGAVLEREGGRYQLQMNVPYRVRRELPDGYVGCIGWKLMVTQNGNDHIHDSVTGLTAVAVQPGYSDEVNPLTGKKIIHVLQITPNLYGNPMDLELQTDLTNAWSGNGNFDEEWYELLTNLPDFEIDFDSIYYWDFAHSFLRPGESGYEAQYDNGGVDGKLTGPDGRNDYLNLYQYDMVIIGFCDMVPSIPSQKAMEALLHFADMGKSMLFTHDTTYSGWENAGGESAGGVDGGPSNFTFSGGLGQSLSMSIRDLCGMDRYGVSVDWYRYDETTGRAMNNREGSPIRTPGAQASAYNASSAAYQWYASHPGGNSRDVAYAPGTNQTMMAAQTQGLTWSMTDNEYFYMYDWASHGKITRPHKNRDTLDAADTNTVTQVNGGIITQYPYDIPLRIEVGDTHAQYYQLDLETDWDGDGRGDVVCWYAMSSLNDGDWNDIYDFSPNDVRNNYYIYNKGNITYTGVGHSVDHITLDEKKLFINTFVAAYSAGIRNPSVRIVENGSVNAPDLENVSIPFNGVDEETAGTYRVYYQVKDNNITEGTRNLSVKYYIGNPTGSGTVTYRTEVISADLFADGELKTYSADTGLEVSYDAVRSGHSYYVDVPLTRLLNNETFDFYVEVDLTMANDSSRVAAFDVDKLTIAKLKMFSLD
ncbi:MAG: DUF5057 domain-containing protein [Lachnospiraceae bacterium]|nr:DUF5057 domain-containing protein [Lachnospiraceae bacterium]